MFSMITTFLLLCFVIKLSSNSKLFHHLEVLPFVRQNHNRTFALQTLPLNGEFIFDEGVIWGSSEELSSCDDPSNAGKNFSSKYDYLLTFLTVLLHQVLQNNLDYKEYTLCLKRVLTVNQSVRNKGNVTYIKVLKMKRSSVYYINIILYTTMLLFFH